MLKLDDACGGDHQGLLKGGGAFTWSTLEVVPVGGGVDEKAEHTLN